MKRLVIIGSGESGTGAAILAKQKGYDVLVSDAGLIPEKYKEELNEYCIAYEEKQHTEALILNADEIIKSPGIPEKNELIKKIRSKGIHIISEIEFASRYTNAIKICITGTNGKTTTTSLIYHLMLQAGLNVGCGGNIGTSFARLVATEEHDYYVLELSSFQLDDMYDFKAEIAILLNITPDHLDRYEYDIQNYINAKFRITRNQTEKDYFIYCSDDEIINKQMLSEDIKAKKIPFSINNELALGAFLDDDSIKIKTEINQSNPYTMLTSELALRGKHNTYNSMAAAIVGQVFNIRKDAIREALTNFQNVEHRLEKVAMVRGVEFINDSKATNVNSAWYA